MAAERTDHDAAARELFQILLSCRFTGQQLVGRTMRIARVAARADFYRVQACSRDFIEHLI
ncbi:hypothetical protein D3C74_430940 [compost metagenome]